MAESTYHLGRGAVGKLKNVLGTGCLGTFADHLAVAVLMGNFMYIHCCGFNPLWWKFVRNV